MAHIVCQATADPQRDELEFVWSEGAGFFEPYHLRGTPLQHFDRTVGGVRKALFKVVLLFRDGKADKLPGACLTLAQAGHELYEALFPPKASQNQDPDEVRDWLEDLRDHQLVESLEVLLAEKDSSRTRLAPRAVPWNVLYDEQPDPDLFLTAGKDSAPWQPFWGVRYNLAMGRKVDPRRRMPFGDKKPHVVFVVDPKVLPTDEWSKLQAFAEGQAYPILRSRADLEKYRNELPVDLLYWLCHADPAALVLGNARIDVVDLYKVCQRLFHRQSRGLVVLNACQTAEEGREGSFMEALHDAGLSGMVATEERTVNIFANRFGLDFLQAFLVDGEAIGPALQKLRAGGHPLLPLGLLYGTYCPPHIHVQRPTPRPAPSVPVPTAPAKASPLEAFVGTFLGPQGESGPPPPLPEHPYRSLAYYDREHRALFAGREADVQRFALMLDEADCRMAVLHGQSGVGKSSFLRAGLIPFLEEECIGYQFLRDRQQVRDEPPLFIRATRDPAGPLAQALCDFCARGEAFATPRNTAVKVDLPGILGRFVPGVPSPAALRDALRADTSLLGQVLAALAERLPYTLVLVMDQGEEVFTLASTREDEDSRDLTMEMLRRVLDAPGRFKVIVSLRTEYYGRLLDALRRDVRNPALVSDYLLTDLQEGELAEAILRPTATARIPHTSEVPAEKYRFRYEPGVADTIAREVRDYCRGKQDSELPLVQIICTQLYELVRQRPGAVITRHDFELIGGVEGGLRKHVEALLDDLLPHKRDRKAFKALFRRLYRRQPDRLVTTELVLEDELTRKWKGRISFGKMLETTSRSDRNLLRVKTLPGEQGERRYLSLGHDALAKVAADWDEEHHRRARVLKKVLLIGGVCLAVSVFFAIWAIVAEIEQAQVSRALTNETAARLEADRNRERAESAEKRASAALFSIYSNRISEAYRDCNVYNFVEAKELLDLCKSETPELCRWEWDYLNQRCVSAKQLKVSKPGVRSVVFSPDGSYLAGRSDDQVVRVWEVAHLDKEQVPLLDSQSTVGSVVFSRDGAHLAAHGDDGFVRVWEVAHLDKEPLALPGSKSRSGSLVFSPDGCHLAARGDDGVVRVWEIAALDKESPPLFGSKGRSGSLVFSPDGSHLAARGDDEGVRVWEVAHPAKEPLALLESQSTVGSLRFSPDSSHLAARGRNGVVRVWEVTRPAKEPLALPRSKFRSGSVVFGPSGSYLAARGDDGVVRVWEVAHLDKEPQTLPGSKSRNASLVFSPQGGHLAAHGDDEIVRVWEVAHLDREPAPLPRSKSKSSSLVFSPDGSHLAAVGERGVVQIWEVAYSVKEPQTLSTGKSLVHNVVFTPDSQRLAGGGDDGVVRVWEVAHPAKEPLEIHTGHDLTVSDVAFSPDGPRVATAGQDGMIRVWKAVTSLKGGEEPLKEICSWKRISASDNLAISRTGQYVATGDLGGMVRIWDVAVPGKAPRVFKGSQGKIIDVAFSPHDDHLAVAGVDRTIRVFDIIQPEKELCSLDEAKDTTEVVFNHDGLCVATVASDGKVRIWDRSRADKVPRSYQVTMTGIRCLAFSPDGNRLAVANSDGVTLCDATSGERVLALEQSNKSQLYYSLTFSPTGTLLAATTNNAVMFWGVTPLPSQK
jgi:WD40 repeat protein